MVWSRRKISTANNNKRARTRFGRTISEIMFGIIILYYSLPFLFSVSFFILYSTVSKLFFSSCVCAEEHIKSWKELIIISYVVFSPSFWKAQRYRLTMLKSECQLQLPRLVGRHFSPPQPKTPVTTTTDHKCRKQRRMRWRRMWIIRFAKWACQCQTQKKNLYEATIRVTPT